MQFIRHLYCPTAELKAHVTSQIISYLLLVREGAQCAVLREQSV